MKAIVHPDTCIGCTMCVSTCPAVFRMEDDKAVVFVTPVPPEMHALCRKAAEECPVLAIEIKEE